jgi:hypothetical protein
MNFKDCTNPQATFDETSKCGVIAEMLGFSGIRMYSDMIPLFKDVLYLYLIMFCWKILNRKQYHGQDYKLFYYQKQP